MKKIISLILVFAALLSFAACTKTDKKDNKSKEKEKTVFEGTDIALKSENFSFTKSEVAYLFCKNYTEFKYDYSENMDMYHIDPDKSLKEQVYYDDVSWFKYFADQTVSYLKELLYLCEAAKEAGMKLSEEDKKGIDETINTWTQYAKDYDYTIEDLLKKQGFNSDVTIDAMKSYMEKETLALMYQDTLLDKYEFPEKELKSFADNHKEDFYMIDYLSFTVDEDECSIPKTYADRLASATSEEDFKNTVSEYVSYYRSEEDPAMVANEALTKMETENSDEYSKWAFDVAKEGDTYTVKNEVDGQFTVYYMVRAPYLNEITTKNIRIITANISKHQSTNNTINYLQGLVNDWKEKGATDEEFAKMAAAYSDDAATKGIGGAKNNVAYYNNMTVPDNVLQWLFEEGRAVGDVVVLSGDKTCYAVYLAGDGMITWQYEAELALGDEYYQNDIKALSEKFKVSTYDNVVQSINS